MGIRSESHETRLAIARQGLPRREGRPKRVLIVGAGMARLVAAWELARAEHERVVPEAGARVGRQVHTLREPLPDAPCAAAHAVGGARARRRRLRLESAMPEGALRELLALAGPPAAHRLEVDISGADPVLRTPYRVGAAGAAALAAAGLAVADLWALRTGRRQRVAVDVRAAAASLRSARYLTVDGRPAPDPWDPLSGFYPVRDGGWISIHCNFANHRAAALGVLGCGPERVLAEGACRDWDGLRLEDAIHGAGGCAGLARRADEWARHPQAAAVAAQPLVEIQRIGEAPPEPLPPGTRPLAGVRVLDLTRVLAGPTCARTLAEHGADVLKITGAHLPDSGLTELDTGLGKLSAHLDLRSPEGTGRLRELLRGADVLSQSYRPGALAARGFSPGDAAALRPGLVYVSLSAWGTSGPWRDRRGFDSIVQSVSGMALASGDGAKPRLMPASAIDYVSGYLMAFGAMVALGRRAREGGSWLVRVALARVGRFIVDQGTIDPARLAEVPPELPPGEMARLTTETRSPAGLIGHLKPVVALSETPPYWARPPVPLGYHPPEWPAR
jgi:crotonobetainyl-CoA:carnitine CoA-transferase CaiB-like acyl-CoA transferase